MRKPLPLGEVALQSNDGEGKPVSQKYLHSDKHWLLSERCYRCAFCFMIASLPSQALRASSPKGRALAKRETFRHASASPRQGRWHAAGVTERFCSAAAHGQAHLRTTSQSRCRSTAPLVGGASGEEAKRCAAPCPLYKYTENLPQNWGGAGKTRKNRFSSCQTGQNALFYSHSLTI